MRRVPAVLTVVAAGLVLAAVPGLPAAAVTAPAAAVTAVMPGNDVQTLAVTAPGDRPALRFRAVAGQQLTVEVVADDLPGSYVLQLIRPGGTIAARYSSSGAAFHAFPVVDTTGTWRLRLVPPAGAVGSLSLLLTRSGTAIGRLQPGVEGTARIPRAGTLQVLRLRTPAGRRPTLTIGAEAWRSAGGLTRNPQVGMSLFRPNGSAWGFFPGPCCAGSWHDSFTVGPQPNLTDVAGDWIVVIRGDLDTVGSMGVRIDTVADQRRSITLGQQAVPVAISTRGQKAFYGFDAVAGQRLALDVLTRQWDSLGSAGNGLVDAALFRPDGSEFQNWSAQTQPMPPAPDWFEYDPFDVSGRWTLMIDPLDDATGVQSMVASAVTDPVPTAVQLGSPLTVPAADPGVNPELAFAATAGRRLVLDIAASDWTSRGAGSAAGTGAARVLLIDPNGVPVSGAALPAQGAAVVDLPDPMTADGSWRLRVDPQTDSVGALSLTLRTVQDVTGPILPGQPVTVTTTGALQQGQLDLDFTGPNFSVLQVAVTGSTFPDAVLRVLDPHGIEVGSVPVGPGDTPTSRIGQLFELGHYRVILDPAGDATGTATITVSLR